LSPPIIDVLTAIIEGRGLSGQPQTKAEKFTMLDVPADHEVSAGSKPRVHALAGVSEV